MIKKEQVIKSLENLPDPFDSEELIGRIIFLEKLETAIKETNTDKMLSIEEAEEEFKKWRKSQ